MASCDNLAAAIEAVASQNVRLAGEVRTLRTLINNLQQSKADKEVENRISNLQGRVNQLGVNLMPLPAKIETNRRTTRNNRRYTQTVDERARRGMQMGHRARREARMARNSARSAHQLSGEARHLAGQARRTSQTNSRRLSGVNWSISNNSRRINRVGGRANQALTRATSVAGRLGQLAGMVFSVLAMVGIAVALQQAVSSLNQRMSALFSQAIALAGEAKSQAEEANNRSLTNQTKLTILSTRIFRAHSVASAAAEHARSNTNRIERNSGLISWIIARLGRGVGNTINNIINQGDTIRNIIYQQSSSGNNSALNGLQRAVNGIQNRLNGLDNRLNGLQPRLSGIGGGSPQPSPDRQRQIDEIRRGLDDLRKQFQDNAQQLAQNAAAIAAAVAAIAGINALINGLNTRLNGLNNRINNMPTPACRYTPIPAQRAEAAANHTNAFLQGTIWVWMQSQWSKLFQVLGTNILPGGLTTAFQKFAKSSIVTRAINLLTFFGVMHNALFLSRSIAQTMGEIISQGFYLVGIRDENDSPIDINQVLVQVGGSRLTIPKCTLWLYCELAH